VVIFSNCEAALRDAQSDVTAFAFAYRRRGDHLLHAAQRGATMVSPDDRVKFDAPAALHKWPSKNNERRSEGRTPYLVADGTLDECIRHFMAKPEATRHLYEIHTAPQPPLVTEVLSAEQVVELARLRDFL
jgi:hypothetical protein